MLAAINNDKSPAWHRGGRDLPAAEARDGDGGKGRAGGQLHWVGHAVFPK